MNDTSDLTQTVSAAIKPSTGLDVLSRFEISCLMDASDSGLHSLFRKCSLAVLSSGSVVDNCEELLSLYPTFDIQMSELNQGIQLEVTDGPATAFIDGVLIEGIRQHLYAVLRDILYLREPSGDHPSHEIFYRLRHANALLPGAKPNTAVCWGGHAISTEEYNYTKEIGYYLGLRGIDICTGCGAGAMKGPMKGAAIAHAKQRHTSGRYIGLTEPGIIAAEAPNAIVNELLVMPDIEKRLEAFIRLGHVLIIFPGGVGTMEELLFILGVLALPENKDVELPIFLSGPESAKDYFDSVTSFLEMTLGNTALNRVHKHIGDPRLVAKQVNEALEQVGYQRRIKNEAFHYNWTLKISKEFQTPFDPTHEAIAELKLSRELPTELLAANLRRALSGIVAGNVKERGIRAIREKGPFMISGEPELMSAMDQLLRSFVKQGRMQVKGKYRPCYQIVA